MASPMSVLLASSICTQVCVHVETRNEKTYRLSPSCARLVIIRPTHAWEWACNVQCVPLPTDHREATPTPTASTTASVSTDPRPIHYPRLVNENIFCQWTDVSSCDDWLIAQAHVTDDESHRTSTPCLPCARRTERRCSILDGRTLAVRCGLW